MKTLKTLSEFILALVFLYTGVIKVLNFTEWNTNFNKLDIVHDLNIETGAYLIPLIEISVASMFFIEKTRKIASYFSCLLMLMFTIYIYYKIYIWEDSLCPCGGIFSQLTLDKHLWVNISLLSIALFLVTYQTFSKTHVNTTK